jgi:hypothetical protein
MGGPGEAARSGRSGSRRPWPARRWCISVSLTTIELKPESKGTRLVFTAHGVFLDFYDDPSQREQGSRWLMHQLAALLGEKASA